MGPILAALGRAAAAAGRAVHFAWTAPSIVGAAFLIAWGAEAAQFMVSQGLALAILAWLQTLPEFAVEADIAWNAARGTPGYSDHLVTANFTGSIRLLMGFGMPMVYFIYALSREKGGKARRWIALDPFHSVEVISLFPPVLYFFFIVYRGRLDLLDSIVLLAFYAVYLFILLKMPPEEEESIEDLPLVARAILRRGRVGRGVGVAAVFLLGGLVLWACVHPFVESMQALAAAVGISGYFFIQWVAPFLSEFPEKVSAFNWARHEAKAKLGLMNFASSNINQMTVLVAMIPIVYCVSAGEVRPILFDEEQKSEVLLTAAQAALCMVLLFNMKFEWWDALGMFVLFFAQFLSPAWSAPAGRLLGIPLTSHDVRHGLVFVYLGWVLLEIFLAMFRVRSWTFPLRLRRSHLRPPPRNGEPPSAPPAPAP